MPAFLQERKQLQNVTQDSSISLHRGPEIVEDPRASPELPTSATAIPEAVERRDATGLLSAVVCPLTPAELPAALTNLAGWAREMASEPLQRPRPMLLFSFNCAPRDDLRDALLAAYREHLPLQEHFEGIEVQFCDLPPEKDVYEKRPTGQRFPYGLKAGPNWLFYETIKSLRSRAQFILLMETDCRPIRPDWLKRLEQVCWNNREAWVVGSHYRGISPLAWSVARHINGNALYNVGDTGFADFLDDVLWPWMHRYIAKHDPALAYDCAWELFLNNSEMEDPGHYDWIVARNVLNRFRICDQIVNVGGTVEQSGDYVWTEEEIRARHSLAAVVHGPLAPSGVAHGPIALGKARAKGNFSVSGGALIYEGSGNDAVFSRSMWLPGKPLEPGLEIRLSLKLETNSPAGMDIRAIDPNGRMIGHETLIAGRAGQETAATEFTLVHAFPGRHAFVRILIRPIGGRDAITMKLTQVRVTIATRDSVAQAGEDLLADCTQILPWADQMPAAPGVDVDPGQPPMPVSHGAVISPGPCIADDKTSIGTVKVNGVQNGSGRANVAISLANVRTGQESWPRVKFKFCINPKGRALEFRKGAGWPEMFDQWPSALEDEHGPVLRVTDRKPLPNQLRRWTGFRDREVVRLIATHLCEILENAAEHNDELNSDILTWRTEARALSERLVEAFEAEAASPPQSDGDATAAGEVEPA